MKLSESGGFPKLSYHFWDPHNQDDSILGSVMGSLFVENYLVETSGAESIWHSMHTANPTRRTSEEPSNLLELLGSFISH